MNRVQYVGAGVALLGLLCTIPVQAQEAVAFEVGLDHIIVKVTNLSRGMEAFTRLTGVVPARGGQHPGRGTENALVSLGPDRYLEILAPLATTPDSLPNAGPGQTALLLDGWALHTRTLGHLIARMRAAGLPIGGPNAGSRRTPDGVLLEWQTAAVFDSSNVTPFFIQWGNTTPHPAGSAPAGCRLASFALVQPDTTRLSAVLRAAGYHATLRVGNVPGIRAVLDCPRGRVSLSS